MEGRSKMAPRRKASSKVSTASILDAFRKQEEHPVTRLAIRTREGEHVIKLPSGTKLLVIHNSDVESRPHQVDLGEVTLFGPVNDFIRWYCYAVLTAAVCLGVAGLLLFFLFPRLVEINGSDERLYPYHRKVVYNNSTETNVQLKDRVDLKYHLKFRIVNNNYIPITVDEISCTVRFIEEKLIINQRNSSQVEVPLRSEATLTLDVEVPFARKKLGFLAKLCNDPKMHTHTIPLKLDVTVRHRTLLGREGKSGEKVEQYVSCGNRSTEEPGGRTLEEEEFAQLLSGEGNEPTSEGERGEGKGEGIYPIQREKDILSNTNPGLPERGKKGRGPPSESPPVGCDGNHSSAAVVDRRVASNVSHRRESERERLSPPTGNTEGRPSSRGATTRKRRRRGGVSPVGSH